MRVFTDHRLIIESEKSNIEMQISFYSKNPITGFFCFERRSDMTYHEFCGGFCQFIMRRFSELTCFMPELYEMFSKEDMPPEEFALRSFCGPFYEEPKKKQLRASDFREMLPDDRKLLFDRLCDIRYDYSKEENVPAYIIFHNRAIYEICMALPESMEELEAVPHVGKKKAEKYGTEILEAVRSYG